MHEAHELWFTALLNKYLAGPAEALCHWAGVEVEHGKPWSNYMAMEILVLLFLIALALLVRPRLSVDRPGKLQLMLEGLYSGLSDLGKEIIGHGYKQYMPFFATIFVFVLSGNLLGLVPTFESPTMYYYVPAGIAICSFLFYNIQGVKVNGVLGHLKHFAGPMWWLAWFMFPLEIISHCIRPVSLTIRLYANMFAGEQVTLGFMALVPFVVPVVFMALHMFVAFVQSFIFALLSMVYVGESVAHEEH